MVLTPQQITALARQPVSYDPNATRVAGGGTDPNQVLAALQAAQGQYDPNARQPVTTPGGLTPQQITDLARQPVPYDPNRTRVPGAAPAPVLAFPQVPGSPSTPPLAWAAPDLTFPQAPEMPNPLGITDPAYLNLWRTQQLGNQQALADALGQANDIRMKANQTGADTQWQGQLQQDQNAVNMEDRGLARSGEREVQQTNILRNQQQRLSGLTLDTTAALDALRAALNAKYQDTSTKMAEDTLSFSGQQYLKSLTGK